VLMIPYMLVVPKGAGQMEETKKFLDYVSQAEPQLRGSILGGYLPLNSKAVLPREAEEQMGMTFEELMQRVYQPDWRFIAENERDRINQLEQLIGEIE
jgi:putative spermidine/putrescine transport system substrate-binding protein